MNLIDVEKCICKGRGVKYAGMMKIGPDTLFSYRSKHGNCICMSKSYVDELDDVCIVLSVVSDLYDGDVILKETMARIEHEFGSPDLRTKIRKLDYWIYKPGFPA